MRKKINDVINPDDVLASLSDDGRKFLLEEFIPSIEQIEEELFEEGLELECYDGQVLGFYMMYLISEIHQFVATEDAYRIRVIKACGHVMGVRQDDIFDVSTKLSLVSEIIDEEVICIDDEFKQKINLHLLEFYRRMFGYGGCSMPHVDDIFSEVLNEIFDEHKETLKLVYDYAGALGDKEIQCDLSNYLREALTS